MAFISDMKVLYHMLVKPVRGDNHAERMESFYGGQATAYDDFRKRLLKGREELWAAIPRPTDGIWVDMGGGTGANIETLADDIESFKKVYVVDLSESLLNVATDRFAARGWKNAEAIAADATKFRPPEGQADVVTFSYSLTMIPDWFSAIENALAMLKPGGHIGVVDFYVGRKHPPAELQKQRWLARSLWQPWFATDNVFPSPDHLPFLRSHFEQTHLIEARNRMPYVPLLKTPYYQFIGRKPEKQNP
ncbi:class I SAM-dependent methyltransferase [Mariniblastus sp.]|nr:class I SAM-dependent methyltransferase [Mariniblastus sp.]MDA7909188.1 class I SAM-dependent methyltransferase [bacterium]MDB4380871.1 class I SAM-dependent methyltransferase [Mariniblastus sp.]